MMLRPIVAAFAFALVQLHSRSVLANTVDSTPVSALEIMVATVGTLFVPVNTILWTQDGSETAGAVGILLGATQLGVGIAMEDEEAGFKAFNIVVGTLGVIAGAGSMLRGMNTRNDAPSRLEIAPVIDLAERSAGLQLIARW